MNTIIKNKIAKLFHERRKNMVQVRISEEALNYFKRKTDTITLLVANIPG